MEKPETIEAETRGASSGAAHGSANAYRLPNETKIKFCNAMSELQAHCILCKECDIYLRWGDGDLCGGGKYLIATNMAYAETTPEFSPNDKLTDHRPETPVERKTNA